MKIALIAGHHRAFVYHWRDRGALPTLDVKHSIALHFPHEPIYNEHHEAEKLAHRVMGAYTGGAEILLCPFYYNLPQKKRWLESNKVDWVVSLHLNASKYRNGSATGFEVWAHNRDIAARIRAQRACKEAAEIMGLRNRGVKYSNNLYILKTNAHELLLELGFITNADDMRKMRKKRRCCNSKRYQEHRRLEAVLIHYSVSSPIVLCKCIYFSV